MTTSLNTTGALRTSPSLPKLPTVPRSRVLLAGVLCAAALPACLQAGGDDFGSASSERMLRPCTCPGNSMPDRSQSVE